MTREHLLILVVLAFVLLINLIVRLLRRRAAGEAPRARESEESAVPPRPQRLPPAIAPRRVHEAPGAAPVPRAVPSVTPPARVRAPVGGLHAVRRGIVLMTILGPCRALEPPDCAG
jgi:hypothetical protein